MSLSIVCIYKLTNHKLTAELYLNYLLLYKFQLAPAIDPAYASASETAQVMNIITS